VTSVGVGAVEVDHGYRKKLHKEFNEAQEGGGKKKNINWGKRGKNLRELLLLKEKN